MRAILVDKRGKASELRFNAMSFVFLGLFKRKPLEVKSKDAVMELLQPTRYCCSLTATILQLQ